MDILGWMVFLFLDGTCRSVVFLCCEDTSCLVYNMSDVTKRSTLFNPCIARSQVVRVRTLKMLNTVGTSNLRLAPHD